MRSSSTSALQPFPAFLPSRPTLPDYFHFVQPSFYDTTTFIHFAAHSGTCPLNKGPSSSSPNLRNSEPILTFDFPSPNPHRNLTAEAFEVVVVSGYTASSSQNPGPARHHHPQSHFVPTTTLRPAAVCWGARAAMACRD